MKTFKIKDLNISIGDKLKIETLCAFPTYCGFLSPQPCYTYSHTACLHACSVFVTYIHCPGITAINCTAGSDWTSPIKYTKTIVEQLEINELAELKAAVSELSQKIELAEKPASLEEYTQLEGKLQEAIKEIQVQKEQFGKSKR
jgi:hypothetical protein